jgi:hypothetical protein
MIAHLYGKPTFCQTPENDTQKTSARAYWGVAYHICQKWNFMNAHPCGRPTVCKTARCIGLLVLIPIMNQFGNLSTEYQLPNCIRSYYDYMCNVFTQREMQRYIMFHYDQLVKNGWIQT